jgi:hypothetical protein
MLPNVKRYGAVPSSGFYFSNDNTYTGLGKLTNYTPWENADFKTYYTPWDAFVPTACAQDSITKATPWECVVAATSFKTLTTKIFVVESQTDKVVMPLHDHDGLPLTTPFSDAQLTFIGTWATKRFLSYTRPLVYPEMNCLTV